MDVSNKMIGSDDPMMGAEEGMVAPMVLARRTLHLDEPSWNGHDNSAAGHQA
jgi:hypothetical protein